MLLGIQCRLAALDIKFGSLDASAKEYTIFQNVRYAVLLLLSGITRIIAVGDIEYRSLDAGYIKKHLVISFITTCSGKLCTISPYCSF